MSKYVPPRKDVMERAIVRRRQREFLHNKYWQQTQQHYHEYDFRNEVESRWRGVANSAAEVEQNDNHLDAEVRVNPLNFELDRRRERLAQLLHTEDDTFQIELRASKLSLLRSKLPARDRDRAAASDSYSDLKVDQLRSLLARAESPALTLHSLSNGRQGGTKSPLNFTQVCLESLISDRERSKWIEDCDAKRDDLTTQIGCKMAEIDQLTSQRGEIGRRLHHKADRWRKAIAEYKLRTEQLKSTSCTVDVHRQHCNQFMSTLTEMCDSWSGAVHRDPPLLDATALAPPDSRPQSGGDGERHARIRLVHLHSEVKSRLQRDRRLLSDVSAAYDACAMNQALSYDLELPTRKAMLEDALASQSEAEADAVDGDEAVTEEVETDQPSSKLDGVADKLPVAVDDTSDRQKLDEKTAGVEATHAIDIDRVCCLITKVDEQLTVESGRRADFDLVFSEQASSLLPRQVAIWRGEEEMRLHAIDSTVHFLRQTVDGRMQYLSNMSSQLETLLAEADADIEKLTVNIESYSSGVSEECNVPDKCEKSVAKSRTRKNAEEECDNGDSTLKREWRDIRLQLASLDVQLDKEQGDLDSLQSELKELDLTMERKRHGSSSLKPWLRESKAMRELTQLNPEHNAFLPTKAGNEERGSKLTTADEMQLVNSSSTSQNDYRRRRIAWA